MGLRKEIKRATKLEMRELEKRAPLHSSLMLRWQELSNLLQSYRNAK